MESLAEDSGIVYLRELLPDDLASGIPSIANGWGNFLRDESAHHDPGRLPSSFVESLRPGPSAELWYAHLMLPHSPWQYLPSGRRYSVRPAPAWGSDEVWTNNQAAVDQSWQRHLMQLGYADRVLGGLISRLRATGLYDRALVVVTADHGVSFRAGQKRRPLSSANLQDIAYVPLFVKLPGQKHGRVVRAPARTIDILPTIARELRVSVPWSLDGRPLLPSPPRERDVVLIKDHGRRFVIPTSELEAKREQALRRQTGALRLGRARGHALRDRPVSLAPRQAACALPHPAGRDGQARRDRHVGRSGPGEWTRTRARPRCRRRLGRPNRRRRACRPGALLGARARPRTSYAAALLDRDAASARATFRVERAGRPPAVLAEASLAMPLRGHAGSAGVAVQLPSWQKKGLGARPPSSERTDATALW